MMHLRRGEKNSSLQIYSNRQNEEIFIMNNIQPSLVTRLIFSNITLGRKIGLRKIVSGWAWLDFGELRVNFSQNSSVMDRVITIL